MSIWAPFGTSDFPLNQPMVGQKEFYEIFSLYEDYEKCRDGNYFPADFKVGCR